MLYLATFCFTAFILSFSQRIEGFGKILTLVLGLFPLIVLAGLRDESIGTDTSTYPVYVFECAKRSDSIIEAIKLFSGIEMGYSALAYVSSRICDSFNFFLALSHALMLFTLSFAYKRFGLNIALAITSFCLIYYSTSLNLMRQFLSIPFCLWSLGEFINKKYRYAAVLFICAYFFHQSSLFFLLIIFLYYNCVKRYRLMKKKMSYFIIAISIVIALLFFHTLLQFFVNSGIAKIEYLERYGDGELYGTNVPLSLIAINTFNLVIFQIMTYKYAKDPFLVFSKYIFIISLFLCFTGLIATFATRIGDYFMMVSIICIIHYLSISKYRFVWFVFAFYLFYWYMVVIVANLNDTYPYKSSFFYVE